MTDTPVGVYVGALPPSVTYGRCVLDLYYLALDTDDDVDEYPELRSPTTCVLKLTPNLKGPVSLADGSVGVVTGKSLSSNNGKFDFWCVDGEHSALNPQGWNWKAQVLMDGALVATFTFNSDSSRDNVNEPLMLGPYIAASTVSTGQAIIQGPQGEPGPQGPAGPAGVGSAVDLSAYAKTADLGSAASQDATAFATAAQGSKADSAVQPEALDSYVQKSALPPLTAPGNLTVTSSDQNTLVATWDAVIGAVAYVVSLDYGTPTQVTGTTKTWTGLDPSSQHNVSVHAVMGLVSADTTSAGTVIDPPVQPLLKTLIAAQNPVVWFPLDDAPGTTNPQQLGSAPVVVNGAAGNGAPTYDGVAAMFDSGTDHCISFHGYDWVGKTNFAWECVVGGLADDGTNVMEADDLLIPTITAALGVRMNFSTDAGTAFTKAKDGTPALTPTDVPHHLACSWDGATYSQYYDGVLILQDYSDTLAIAGALKQPAAGEIYIGAAYASSCGNTMHDVAFYDHPLSAQEIADHAAAI